MPPDAATAVAVRPAPRSWTLVHSVPLRMAYPWVWTQMCRPPAIQTSPFFMSAASGAMKRASLVALSGGATAYEVALPGSVVQLPSFTAQFWVTWTAR